MTGAMVDITQFYSTFFDEADELLADMERLLLALDVAAPDTEQLNAIFRAAHSIKGGAATFGFSALTDTTHLLENLLDRARRGELALRPAMIDTFLETKDVLQQQLNAYRAAGEPDAQAMARICAVLQQLAAETHDAGPDAGGASLAAPPHGTPPAPATIAPPSGDGDAVPAASPRLDEGQLEIRLSGVGEKDQALLLDELGNLGEIKARTLQGDTLTVRLATACSADDIVAVCCFVIEPSQIEVTVPGTLSVTTDDAAAVRATDMPPLPPESSTAPARVGASSLPAGAGHETSSIRVGVEKVDQLINLVGELVITQAMLAQTAGALDPVLHEHLAGGMGQLERNARDLQEAVMAIRMMPMDYVFSRFPRMVRDLAGRLGKQVELVTFGQATELDKSLIERIIDPLTHLVRNSLDHGIEAPEVRAAAGKDPTGQLVLSAAHKGGSILIEVSDDGAGLRRDKILAKAARQGLPASDAMSDEEVWQLIFMPGFSTADAITDISGRGVGMDVVKRNIQNMGGHVEIASSLGRGTTIRIVLPLTLAILDGMSVKAGDEIFILPLNFVMESLQPRREDIRAVAGEGQVILVRGEYLPLVELHRTFDVPGARTDPTQGIVVILQAEGRRFALLVDELVRQQQVVVKNLETNYRRVHGISAATILGDGSVALIVDVAALQRGNRDHVATIAA